MGTPEIGALLRFWFDELTPEDYWRRNEALDARIRADYAGLHERAARGELAHWADSADGALALVIALDQLPRNIFRDSPHAWATDAKALAAAESAIAAGLDREMSDAHRLFLYMPFQHSEELAVQERSLILFRQLPDSLDFARRHHEIIQRFGRFPHRNAVLGRESTPEELEFLKQPNSSF